MSSIQVTDSNFNEQVLNSDLPVLVDFWASWCGPCKMLAPTIDDVASEMTGTVRVAKVNIDDNPNTPSNFGVQSIPTMILFKNGKPVSTKVGNLPKAQIISWIKESV